jgi:predicted ATPase
MCLSNPNLFVISGGPGAGKTTVLEELAKLGSRHAPEVARQIIQEQVYRECGYELVEIPKWDATSQSAVHSGSTSATV